MNKNYLKYLFKSRKSLCVVVISLYILTFVTCFSAAGFKNSTYPISLAGISAVAGILCYALVPIVFGYINDSKAVDEFFSLPIRRKEMLKTSLLFIDLIIIVPFVILSIVCFMMGIASHGISSFYAYLGYQLVGIIGVIVLTLFNTSVFVEANSTFDGVVMMLAYALIPLVLLIAISSFQDNCIAGLRPINTNFAWLSLPTAVFSYAFSRGQFFTDAVKVKDSIVLLLPNIQFCICFVWHFIFSIISLRRNFIERKVERAGSVSNRFFAYPFVINVYTFLIVLSICLFNNAYEEQIIFTVLIFVCYMVSTFVYQKHIKIEVKNVLFYIVIVMVSLGISYVGTKTKGFNLAYAYDHNPKNVAYSYDSYMIEDFDSKLGKLVKDKYPNSNFYEISLVGKVDNKNMLSDSNIYKMLEEKRLASIDNFYNNEEGGAYLILSTNYDEELYSDAGSVIQNDYSNNKCQYYHSPYLTYEEIMLLKDNSNIVLQIETDNTYYDISLDELLNS